MIANAVPVPDARLQAKVFISYSRKDMAFADRLETALRARGFAPLIDRTQIYAFEDWWQRIEKLIGQADTIVFVLSPDSARSDVALREIAYAASLNKRFAPIVCRRTEARATPEILRRLNFIFFDDPVTFDVSADVLAEALLTDMGWIRLHTEFAEQARRWSVAGRPGPRGLLLRSPVLEEAERWIASRPPGAPQPTEETQAFVAESRRAATRRRNILTGALATGLLAALVLFGIALWQRDIAVRQTAIAERKTEEAETQSKIALRNQSRLLAAISTVALQTSPVRAAKLALAAWPRSVSDQTPKLDVVLDSLAAAVRQLHERRGLRGHTDKVGSAIFSADGMRVVTASDDGAARIWDANSGSLIAVLSLGIFNGMTGAFFSRDGARVVTISDGAVAALWDAKTGRRIATLAGHQAGITAAAFSRDGTRIVTTSADRTARVWDGTSGEQLLVLRGHEDKVENAAFSSDGARLVTVSDDNTGRVWDTKTGKQLFVLQGHELDVTSAAYSADDKYIVTASLDSTARLWDAKTGRQVSVLRGHEAGVVSAGFSPDSKRVITASADDTARIWDTENAKQVAILQNHGGDSGVRVAAFSPDGMRVITVADENVARLWDAETGAELVVLRGHDARVVSAAFSPDGRRIVTASADRTARIWDAEFDRDIAVVRGVKVDPIVGSLLSADGSRLAVISNFPSPALLIFEAATGKQLAALRSHGAGFAWMAFSSNGSLITSNTTPRTLGVWDVNTGDLLYERTGLRAGFSTDGAKIVIVTGDKTARILDARSGRELVVLRGHEAEVSSAEFSPDGRRIITASLDRTARVWDASTGEQLAVLKSDHIASASFMPDGKRVITEGGQNTMSLWSVETRKELFTIRDRQSDGQVGYMFPMVSPGGDRILATSLYDDNVVRVWDAATGKELRLLQGHNGRIRNARWSLDGMRVITTSSDGSAQLWDIATGTELHVIRAYGDSIWWGAFLPDGKRLVVTASNDTGSENRPIRILDISAIPGGNLFQVACAWLPDRDLGDIAKEYGLSDLEPICKGDVVIPDVAKVRN